VKNIAAKVLFAPALLSAFALAEVAQAQDLSNLAQVSQYAAEGAAMGQVTSVSQLRDVRPTDWAFQALQSLVERYGCIAGYPDGTYRGNRAMTRYEFAAGLNACLDRVNELIASATADLVTQEDLAVLQRLQEEFQAELATLRGRVDALEARTSELEANQFSTTTKLSGKAIFDLGSVFTGESDGDGSDAEDEVVFASRVRLRLKTSFTGKDELRTRLQASNFGGYSSRFEGGNSFDGADASFDSSGNNGFVLEELYYRFPVGPGRAFVGTRNVDFDNIVPTRNNLSLKYAFLDFFQSDPGIFETDRGTGFGYNLPLGERLNLTTAYLANDGDASSAGDDNGLTGGSNTALAQVTFTPTDRLTGTFAYARTYDPDGASTTGVRRGTDLARRPFTDANGDRTATRGNNFSLTASYKFPRVDLSGFVGFSNFEEIDTDDNADVLRYAVNVGFPDLFREGNYGGFGIGVQPHVTGGDVGDEDAPLAAEIYYSHKLSSNIQIQPQLFFISNPDGDSGNDSIWAGSVKTTFSF